MLTVNYGVRFDHYAAFSSGSQLSPRVNFVWQAARQHHRACRLLALLLPAAVRAGRAPRRSHKFVNTTAAPEVLHDDTVKPERSNYYDLGVQQVLGKDLTLGRRLATTSRRPT